MSQLDEGALAPGCPRGKGLSTDDGCRPAPAVVAGSLEQAACALAAGAADEAIAPAAGAAGEAEEGSVGAGSGSGAALGMVALAARCAAPDVGGCGPVGQTGGASAVGGSSGPRSVVRAQLGSSSWGIPGWAMQELTAGCSVCGSGRCGAADATAVAADGEAASSGAAAPAAASAVVDAAGGGGRWADAVEPSRVVRGALVLAERPEGWRPAGPVGVAERHAGRRRDPAERPPSEASAEAERSVDARGCGGSSRRASKRREVRGATADAGGS